MPNQRHSFLSTHNAVFMPSAAAEVMPPAYPAPSPHGISPCKELSPLSPLIILTGELERVSTPVSNASAQANPFIFASNCGRASLSPPQT